MDKKKNYCWRFTLVNRFTLEKIDEVFTFSYDLPHAIKKIQSLFPPALYMVEDSMMVRDAHLVIVGYSNVETLL